MMLQGLGALIYGAMVMAILAFTNPSTVSIAVLVGALFAYTASLAGYLYESSRMRAKLFNIINLAAWALSILFSLGGVALYVLGV